MKTLDPVVLAADLRTHAFAGADPTAGRSRRGIGAEAEFIPVEHGTGLRCPIESDEVIATLPFLRDYGRRERWIEGCTSKGTPCFSLPDGGNVTFEPGGQLEYSSPPCQSASGLLTLLRAVVLPLQAAASNWGITLLTCGIDPLNPIEQAPLLIHAKRYERMARYLARRSEAGARMMRQTASFQLSLDFDEQTWLRWRVLNAAAPYITAIFANSPIYARQHTEFRSARAAVWREVDPLRTGLPYGAEDPIGTYLQFALAAPAILLPVIDGEHRPFGEWLVDADPTLDEWHEHLSTLFPEVRPRGHVELRSADALAPEWYAAPLALTAGITYDTGTLQTANELLGTPDPELLIRGGQHGLRNAAMASVATDLFQLALTGCRRLGPAYFHPADLDEAVAFFERFTRRGRAPADELVENAIAA